MWGAMLEAYHKLETKPKTSAELKETFQVIWDNLPHGSIDKAVKDFLNKATGGWRLVLYRGGATFLKVGGTILRADRAKNFF